MFRKPMRLEKWIAFDGAVGADAVTLVQDALPDADAEAFTFVEAEAASAAPFADVPIPGAAGNVNVTIPDDPVPYPEDNKPAFIFDYDDVTFDIHNNVGTVSGTDFTITLTAPDGGKFDVLTVAEVTGNEADALANFAAGDWIAVFNESIDQVVFRKIISDSSGGKTLSHAVSIGVTATVTHESGGGISLKLNNDAGNVDAFKNDDAIKALLCSIVFEADTPGNPPEAIGGFDVEVSYKGSTVGGVVEIPDGNGGGGNPQPPPPVDIITPPPPPPPPPHGGGESGGGETGGETGGGESGGEGDGGGDSGGEGDSGDAGDAPGGDDMNYIYHQDEDGDSDDDGSDAESARNDNRQDQTEAEIVVAIEDRTMESAAAVTAVELAREVEFLLTSVRSEREVLLNSLSRLQEEYLRKSGRVPDEDFRALLRRLFESGNREKEAMNRIIAEMNRQMDVYRTFAPEFRDGMLTESLRELVDSAERRTGETGALSQAIDAVVRMLSREGALPETEEVSAVFEKTHAAAIRKWHEKAELSDPMGKELAVMERESAISPPR